PPASHQLLFHSYADHRYLHSFPTRRSSDLPQAARRDDDALSADDTATRRRPCTRPLPIRCPLPTTPGCAWTARRTWSSSTLPSSDRKSTRLNSSHSQISYAVFCLKKKKKHLKIYDDRRGASHVRRRDGH